MPRKKPYSGKQKKAQLQERKKRKQSEGNDSDDDQKQQESEASSKIGLVEEKIISSNEKESQSQIDVLSIKQQPAESTKSYNPHRYRLQFLQESNAELKRKKELGRQVLKPLPEIALEVSEDHEDLCIDIAKRPPWNYTMSTKELETAENKYFREYVDNIFSNYDYNELSYFELNLETWRQLWRVLEMSDILLMIVDIRYPLLHFSPALYHHVVSELGKHAVLVLNKVDMVAPELVVAWKEYFLSKYPDIHVACFTSYPKDAVTNQKPGKEKKKRKKRKGGRFTANLGAFELLEICERIVHNKVDLSSWRHKIESESIGEVDGAEKEETVLEEEVPSTPTKSERYKNGILSIGCIGYPNVGKSSLLNGLKGMKVVSVSRTPGHTKHFQTIFLTKTVKLCDCPGLVFPSKVDKGLQVLAGIYPISQIREPFSAIRYLAERINVVSILHLQHPDPRAKEWSPYDICEAFALKRGLLTAKAGRPDINRSSNMILRMGLDGRLCLATRPPGFTKNRDVWKTHRDTLALIEKLAKYCPLDEDSSPEVSDDDIDEEDEEEISDSGFEDGMTTKNPYAILSDD